MSATFSCEAVRDLLPERLGGDLDELRARGVDGHLATCGPCRAEEAELAALLGALAAAVVPDPGARYWDRFAGRVRTRIAAEGMAQHAPRRWRWAPALTLAASLAVIAFAAVRAPLFGVSEEEDPLLASY